MLVISSNSHKLKGVPRLFPMTVIRLFVFFHVAARTTVFGQQGKEPYTLENQVVSIIISKRILIYASAGFLIGEKCRVLHRNS